jgi:hypothetical protein
MMDLTNDVGRPDAIRLSRSWIDVFAGCGTVMGRILPFLDEADLLHLETTSDEVTSEVTWPQWEYLDRLDRSRTTNKRWRQPEEPPPTLPDDNVDARDHHPTRLRGIEFARNALYAKKRAEEEFLHFEFDRDDVSTEDIPVRHGIRLIATKRGKLERPPPMPTCWQKWADLNGLAAEGTQAIAIDVFLELSYHRDDPPEILSWKGFRKARYKRYEGISLKLDLESLAEEMGWREVLEFRDMSQDYEFTHYEVQKSQQQMKSLMQKIQVTLHRVENDGIPSDHDPLLLIATGGYAAPMWARRGTHMVLTRNANIARFHCRNGRQPLEETFEDASRSTSLRIPTPNSTDQSLGIILKILN